MSKNLPANMGRKILRNLNGRELAIMATHSNVVNRLIHETPELRRRYYSARHLSQMSTRNLEGQRVLVRRNQSNGRNVGNALRLLNAEIARRRR